MAALHLSRTLNADALLDPHPLAPLVGVLPDRHRNVTDTASKNLCPLIEQVNEDRTAVEITSKPGSALLMPGSTRSSGDPLYPCRLSSWGRRMPSPAPAGTMSA